MKEIKWKLKIKEILLWDNLKIWKIKSKMSIKKLKRLRKNKINYLMIYKNLFKLNNNLIGKKIQSKVNLI